jgi:hypothetical protein
MRTPLLGTSVHDAPPLSSLDGNREGMTIDFDEPGTTEFLVAPAQLLGPLPTADEELRHWVN